MFANYLIGLREGLEAALVVSILIAYLVRTDRRDRLAPVGLGVAAAVAVSVAFGALLTYTSANILQTGQSRETFGGTLSIVAVGFVTWMIFWMRRTAQNMRADLSGSLEVALDLGAIAVAATAFMAVAREGLETALFFWSAVQAAGSTLSPVVGFALGVATAVVLARLLYRRSVTLDLARFFTWTGAALVVVAAGVLAYGVHDLQEGGVLGGLDSLAFDISAQMPPGSWYGTLLKGTINLSPQTTVLQAVVWVAYIVPVMLLFLRRARVPAAASRPPRRRYCSCSRDVAAPVGRRRRSRRGRRDRERHRLRDHPRVGRLRQPDVLREERRLPGHRGVRLRHRRSRHGRDREHRARDEPRPRRLAASGDATRSRASPA